MSTTDKPAGIKIRNSMADWRKLCEQLAETNAGYRSDFGKANYHTISIAARQAGFAEITDANYQSVIESLHALAETNAVTVNGKGNSSTESANESPALIIAEAPAHSDQRPAANNELPSTDEFSANFYLVTPTGVSVQITLRGAPSVRQIKNGFDSLLIALEEGHRRKFQPKESAKPAGVPPLPSGAVPPPPPIPPVPAAPEQGEAQCLSISIGNGYKSGKPQLKFACVGFDKPLTFSKGLDDMAKLVAPIGLVREHLVVGQTYNLPCKVTWKKSGQYTDVLAVTPA
jgi:hypothetical protein